MQGQGWIDSINLQVGMQIEAFAENRHLTVIALVEQLRTETTYNLEVDEFHTYFVGKMGAWVHNQNNNGPCVPCGGTYLDANGRLRASNGRYALGGVVKKVDDLGLETTTPAMRKSVQGKAYIDPLSNKVVIPSKDVVMSPDHIYPVSKIKELPGFDSLSVEQKKAIIHDTVA